MGVNASTLLLTHYEDLPPDVLRNICKYLVRPKHPTTFDDGTFLPKVSRVCVAWKHTAGECAKTLKVDCLGSSRDSQRLYQQYPNLQELSVFGRVSYGFLAQFGALAGLRELTLKPDTYRKLLVTDNEDMLLARLTQLTKLVVCQSPHSGRYLKGREAVSFSCLVNLKELLIDYPTPTVYLYLGAISTLTKLSCGQWEDEIVGLSQLQKLDITNCKDEAFPGTAVSNLSKLVSLRLGISNGSPLNFTRLGRLHALSKLHLHTGSYIADHMWHQLATLSRLQSLHYTNPDCGRLILPLIQAVLSLKQLVYVSVSVQHVDNTGSALGLLHKMSCLESMQWVCTSDYFPADLRRQAESMMKNGKLKAYVIEDLSGVSVA